MDFKIMYNGSNKIHARILRQKLIDSGFNETDKVADCVFIIGGDGSFLHALRELKYNNFPIYIGINAGTLGYLQDVSLNEVDKLITYLKDNSDFSASKMSLASISFCYNDGKVIKDNAINELQISGKHSHKVEFELTDCIAFKEEVTSSGIVFATPYGSTAYNKSLSGPVICQGVDVLCATLIAPIQNSKTKDYIQNSLISNRFSFNLLTDPEDVEVMIDGQIIDVNFYDLSYIMIEIGKEQIFKLDYDNNSYSKNMLDKMLKA